MFKLHIKLSFYIPRLSLTSLLVCLVSGFILTYQYHPFGNVFKNVEEITTVIPYGFFFRRLHYASGELFAILMLFHIVDHFLRRRYKEYSVRKWARLVIPLGICFFILFTGYILKGDKEGIYAGNIFYNIMKEIPAFGDTIAGFFMRPGDAFYWLPYLYHCFFMPVLLIFFIRRHINAWLPDAALVLFTIAGLFAYSLFIRMPLDIPPQANIRPVMGPWFFLGIQVCLSIIPPFFAGIVIPLTFITLLLLLPLLKGRIQTIVHYGIIAFSLLYACLIIFGYFFMEYAWSIS